MRKRFNKRLYIATLTFTFIGVLTFIVILNFLSKPKAFSEEENRSLAQMPKFSMESLLDGRYTKKVEKYISDQFIGRNSLMAVKFKWDMLLGKSDENGVYICENDYLIEEFIKPDAKALDNKIETINEFVSKYENIKKYMIIAPNAITVHKDKLPKNAPSIDQEEYISNIQGKLSEGVTYVDTVSILKEHSQEYIYYKTDHHWTTLGAYYAYLQLAKTLDIEIKENYYDVLTVTNNFYGTLSSKIGVRYGDGDAINVYIPKEDSDEVIVKYEEEKKKSPSLYDSEKLKEKDKYTVFLEGNHALVKISTTAKNNDKILIMKDSYANCFVQFLTPYFSEIIMVDPRYYYENIDELIREEEVTHMLFLYNANTFLEDNSLELLLKQD